MRQMLPLEPAEEAADIPGADPGEKTLEPDGASGQRVFAPQTFDRGRPLWAAPRAGAFARLPGWVLLSGIGGILIVVCIVIYLLRSPATKTITPVADPSTANSASGTGPTGTGSPVQGPIVTPGMGSSGRGPLIPGGSTGPRNTPGSGLIGTTPTRTVNPPPSQSGIATVPPGPSEAAHVYEPGTVPRSPDLWYIIIASSKSRSITEFNAKFLADHGVDVSIETKIEKGATWFVIISVRGFPSYTAAEPFVRHIVEVGHEHPDYKRTRTNVWDGIRSQNKITNPAASGR